MVRQVQEERLSVEELNRATLARQGLLEPLDLDPVAAVAHLAGLQAQEPAPPFWALAARLRDFAPDDVASALRDGRLVRAPWLRATLHTITAGTFADQRRALSPMLEAAGRTVVKGRGGEPLDVAATLAAARELLVEGPRTFNELRAALAERFPRTDDRALGYLTRTHLPLVIAPSDDRHAFPRDPRFGLPATVLDEDAGRGLERLVLDHLRAFGPSSAADVQTWSAVTKLGPVLERLHERGDVLAFAAPSGRRTLYDLPDAPRPDPATCAPPRVLGAFDQMVLAHADRSRIVDEPVRKALFTSKNLRIPGVLLVDGRVAGRTRVERSGRRVTLALAALTTLRKADARALEHEAERLLALLEPDATTRAVRWDDA